METTFVATRQLSVAGDHKPHVVHTVDETNDLMLHIAQTRVRYQGSSNESAPVQATIIRGVEQIGVTNVTQLLDNRANWETTNCHAPFTIPAAGKVVVAFPQGEFAGSEIRANAD